MGALGKIISALVSATLIFTALTPIIFNRGNFTASAGDYTLKTVIIDAGHGGFDGGAVAKDGTIEKDINLFIATCLSEILAYNGYNVIMTRTTDTGTEDDLTKPIQKRKVSDLKNRLTLMGKYDNCIFVSIHLNKFSGSAAKGAQVFYSHTTQQSKVLGGLIQSNIKSLLQPDNSRIIKKGTKSTYLLYNATAPAVIVECGFLSNPNELERLKVPKYQEEMAFAVYCGINDYYLQEK